MSPALSKADRPLKEWSIIFLISDIKNLPAGFFSGEEKKFIAKQRKELKKELIWFHRLDMLVIVQFVKEEKDPCLGLESCRKAGDAIASLINEHKFSTALIDDVEGMPEKTLALAEGMSLGNYQFLKYKKDPEKKNSLEKIAIRSEKIGKKELEELTILLDSVSRCRDFVNEPFSELDTAHFAKEIEKMAEKAGIQTEVLKKKKIEALKMGGLLAVNKASNHPPAFVILEWNPPKKKNKKPVILVGKGIVYDSGGMNLKPGDSMTTMKDDMSGAAAVATAIYGVALAKLPLHVIALIPITDNKIGPDAIMPGDVIRMHNGTTVEVINTDAEGRLILADALSYASKYKPELVIELSTLTGAAVRAIGKFGTVAMQVNAEQELEQLKTSGRQVHERIVEFPAWEEYGDLIKSDIADLKNLGPGEAGAITAGKFLMKFTDYPYIHLDIAGPAYLEKRDTYRGTGGTGTGVRLIFEFLKTKVK